MTPVPPRSSKSIVASHGCSALYCAVYLALAEGKGARGEGVVRDVSYNGMYDGKREGEEEGESWRTDKDSDMAEYM